MRIVGSGKQLVDATYIDNAAHAHVLALDRIAPGAACAGKTYYITNGEPWPIADIVNGILESAGVPPVTRHISPSVAYAVGAVLETIYNVLGRRDEPPMTRFIARQLGTAHWYNITAARRDLGFEPIVSMREGLNRLRESYSAAT
jgi:nucleoside-diphosphate-sugar epimerase